MKTLALRFAAGLAVLLLSACATPPYDYSAETLRDLSQGYYPASHINLDDDNLLILTFSGGGMRAASFAQGALEALDAVPLNKGTMLDEVDMISSTSGGTVAAANYVLFGREGFTSFRDNFLYKKLTIPLIVEAVTIPPLPWSFLIDNNRIEAAIRMFERLVGGATYGDIRADAPYWIANTTDIATGRIFPLTQYQFDIICSELSSFPIARAIAASSAFPIATSSVVIRNSAPCPEQRVGDTEILAGHLQYIDFSVAPSQLPFLPGNSPSQIDRARAAQNLMKLCADDAPCDRPEYIHLFDGGIADNLGLSEPLWLLTGSTFLQNTPFKNYLKARVKRVAVVSVNAASSHSTSIGKTPSTPSIFTTISSILGSTIDRRSIGLTAQASALRAILGRKHGRGDRPIDVYSTTLSFAQIVDPICRTKISELGTNWGLERHEVDALINLGAAMSFGAEPFQRLAGLNSDTEEQKLWDETARCYIRDACACMSNPEACLPAKPRYPYQCEVLPPI